MITSLVLILPLQMLRQKNWRDKNAKKLRKICFRDPKYKVGPRANRKGIILLKVSLRCKCDT